MLGPMPATSLPPTSPASSPVLRIWVDLDLPAEELRSRTRAIPPGRSSPDRSRRACRPSRLVHCPGHRVCHRSLFLACPLVQPFTVLVPDCGNPIRSASRWTPEPCRAPACTHRDASTGGRGARRYSGRTLEWACPGPHNARAPGQSRRRKTANEGPVRRWHGSDQQRLHEAGGRTRIDLFVLNRGSDIQPGPTARRSSLPTRTTRPPPSWPWPAIDFMPWSTGLRSSRTMSSATCGSSAGGQTSSSSSARPAPTRSRSATG